MRYRAPALAGLLVVAWALFVSSAGAVEKRLQFPSIGAFAEPRGLAVDQGSHDVGAIDGRNEVQTITVSASAGKFKLKFGGEEKELAFNAKAEEMRTALRSMACGGGACVAVSGGPGNETGSSPYEVTFVGALRTTDVPQIECENGSPPLSGGSASCTVATKVNGVNGNVTRLHANGTASNFTALGSNAIDGRGPGLDQTPQNGLTFSALAKEAQLAIDESGGETDGEVYLTQAPNHLADIFSSEGKFLGQLTEFKEGPTASGPLKALSEPCGVAVDGAGNVYVADFTNGIHKYDPSGKVVTNADNVANFTLSEACTLAAGAGPTAGFLFADTFKGELFKLDATTGAVKYEISKNNTTVTVDPTSGHVLAAAGNEVKEWDASGASSASLVGSIPAGSAVNGVAVDGTTGKNGSVYLARSGVSHLDVYSPYLKLALAVTNPATEVGGASARLNGTLSADGGPSATCHFEYLLASTFAAQKKAAEEASKVEPKTKTEITEAAFVGASSAACEPPGPFSGSTVNVVSAEATGLQPESGYEFRIVGDNAEGSLPASELSFETLGKPEIEGGAASQVTSSSAQITSQVNPRGEASAYSVQYVTQAQFEASEFEEATTVEGPEVPPVVLGEGNLSTATGTGDLAEGFTQVKDLKTTTGAFAVGQSISGTGIKAGTTIAALGSGTLTLSQPAEASGGDVALSAASTTVTNLATATGAFAAGQAIEGTGIPAGTTVLSASPTQLVLSKAPTTAGEGVALSAQGFQPVSLQLTGLTADTAYRFRGVAASNAGMVAEAGPHAFATSVPLGPPLPDERAWELVSPAVRMGEVFPPKPTFAGGGSCGSCTPGWNNEKAPMQSSPDGNAVAYEGDPFFPGLASETNSYVSRRGATGWQTTGLSEPQFNAQDFKAFSPDLSIAVLEQTEPALTPEAPPDFANLYLREEGGALTTLNTTEPPNRSAGETGENRFEVDYAGANSGTEAVPAFSHVVFQANDALTPEEDEIAPAAPEVAANQRDLYEWSEGKLHLVNVLPGNAAAAPNAVIGSGLLFGFNFDFDHAISADGSRVFWSAVPSGQLYVREGGSSTTEIPDHVGKFLTATPDGSKVLLSDGILYDLETEAPTDLTSGAGGFQGLAGAAEDLSRIYFVDTKALTPPEEENANGEAAEEGKFNLYLWEEGEAHFIAILLAGDNEEGSAAQLGVWHASPDNRLAQATADGRFMAFVSKAQLSGYDNLVRGVASCLRDGSEGTPICNEVFLYDAQSKTLTCASCNPHGERPLGGSNLSLIDTSSDFLPQPDNLPPTGEGRLFFESLDQLVPGDTNGRIQDVYEFEPNGVGSCERAKGCLSLISGGHGPKDSQFINASANGEDVFFITRDQLVHTDQNELMDLYDARVGGGIEEEAPESCQGEGCAGPIPGPPPFEAPSSSGTKPEPELHCRRGYQRKGNRCVRRHRHHRKHHHHRVAAHRRGA